MTDLATKKLGLRWGRSLPLIGCYAVASIAYLSCPYLESVWAFIAAAAVVAFATDMSIPVIWAYMQDVGGKNTAAVFGWGNMWGNFGAGTMASLVPFILERWDHDGNWHVAFYVFAGAFFIAGLSALGINAKRKIG